MDLKKFSENDFNVKQWINETCKSSEKERFDKEIFISSVINEVQLHIKKINENLEKTSNEVISDMPKILNDIHQLQNETKMIMDDMKMVKNHIANIENNTKQSIEEIEKLDKMKDKLECALKSIHEADNWTVTANELEELFESGDIDTITEKIINLQQSLQVLLNDPDFENKKLYLDGVKNRLEALTSPLVVKTFTTLNADKSNYYVKIFSSIGRLPQLLKYYQKCQKNILSQKWRNIIEIEQDDITSSQNIGISNWLCTFYDNLLTHCNIQLKWLYTVLDSKKESLKVLFEIYIDLFTSMDPSIDFCIEAALKQQTDDRLGLLITLKQSSKHFLNNLQGSIENFDSENSITFDNISFELIKSIYLPYVKIFKKYSTYEELDLNQKLMQMFEKDQQQADLSEKINSFNLKIPAIFDLLQNSIKRCQLLTEGCGFFGLINAFKLFFSKYIDMYRVILREIEKLRLDHLNENSNQEDWQTFQLCLTLLQTFGHLMADLNNFEIELTKQICETEKQISGEQKNPFKKFKQLFLDEADQKTFNKLMNQMNKFSKSDENYLFEDLKKTLTKLCNDTHYLLFQVIFKPISVQLEIVKNVFQHSSTMLSSRSDLPDYSFSPQEYITQVGQYLMTVPQHLEPFFLQDNNYFKEALKVVDTEYATALEDENGLAKVLLSIISRKTCQLFCDNIMTINELKGNENKQLATDIDYLGNILEDLDLKLSNCLSEILLLLRLPVEEYHISSNKCSPKYVAAVRQMRNITLTSKE